MAARSSEYLQLNEEIELTLRGITVGPTPNAVNSWVASN